MQYALYERDGKTTLIGVYDSADEAREDARRMGLGDWYVAWWFGPRGGIRIED